MRTLTTMALVLSLSLLAAATSAKAEIKHRFGVGAHYWTAIDDIDVDDVKEDGFAYLVSYQLRPASLIKFGLDVEMLPEEFGGADESVFAPQAYLILGSSIYAGLGIGTYFTDGEFADDPFYNLRVGLDLCLLPLIYLDINANYRFEEWDSIKSLDEDVDSDTITLGAAVRIEL